MDLPTISMNRNVARQAVVQYRRAMQEARTEREVRELASGTDRVPKRDDRLGGWPRPPGGPTSRVSRCIGPAEDRDRPRRPRAMARYPRYRDGRLIFGRNITTSWRSSRQLGRGLRQLPAGTLPTHNAIDTRGVVANAIVPIIPPELRPNASLDRYWILFEAEWSRVAPSDPALLRDLGGGLYAVLATWDLTDLERTVLGMTRAPQA